MLQLEHSYYLWGIAVLLPLSLFFILFLWWRSRAIARFGSAGLSQLLAPNRSLLRHIVKFVFLTLAIPFLFITLANPLMGTKIEKVKREGVDVMIALDVSKSMMAEDVKPNRLARAKMFVSKFLDQLSNDRVGLVVFAGKAYLQMPMTVDYAAGKMYLENLSTDLIPTQGTAIAEAVDMARKSFKVQEHKHKVLIIITDGEDHEGADEEAIEDAQKEGIIVHTVGVGTEQGAPIPEYPGGPYKKDNEGNIVLTKINSEMLNMLADKGHGKSYRISTGEDPVKALIDEIDKMEKKSFEERMFTDFDSQFQYFLAAALLLIIVEFFITERGFIRHWLSKINL